MMDGGLPAFRQQSSKSESKSMSNLPASITNMATALVQSSVNAGAAGGGELYMQFTKFGEWVYGMDKTEVEEGAQWAVNPEAFTHGFIAWDQDNTSGGPTGEMMVPATQPMPLESDLPAVSGKWGKAIGIVMRCTNGEDKGTQVLFKSNSLGGRKCYAAILQAVVTRIQEGNTGIVPLVELKADSYTHKTYGKIFTPEIEVVGWTDMEGNAAEEPAANLEAPEEAPAEEPAPEEKPARRRRRKAS